MDPVRLVELRRILASMLRVEVVMSGGDEGSVVDSRLLIYLLSWKRIAGRFLLVDVAVELLLGCTHLLVVLFELLGRCEPWQQREIRSH